MPWKNIEEEPAFAALIEQKRFDRPKTDEIHLYCTDGPRLTLNEIIEMAVR